jgi:hypothetical protein
MSTRPGRKRSTLNLKRELIRTYKDSGAVKLPVSSDSCVKSPDGSPSENPGDEKGTGLNTSPEADAPVPDTKACRSRKLILVEPTFEG